MKHALDWDLIETRETIRQAAYDIASSGACDGWQDVWRFLRTTFGVEQLVDIFWNPLCQMDLDQRCSRARSSGKVLPNDEKSDPSEISRKTSLEIATTKHPDSDRQMQGRRDEWRSKSMRCSQMDASALQRRSLRRLTQAAIRYSSLCVRCWPPRRCKSRDTFL